MIRLESPAVRHLDARLFHYDAGTRTFTAEWSDLPAPSLPRTLVLFNKKTGGRCTFEYAAPETDPDGETVAHVYRNTFDRLTVRVYND